MPLKEVQDFLTRYIRDRAFREGWRGNGRAELAAEIGLTEDDLSLIQGIPLEDLDRTADGFRADRVAKRRSEFTQFLEHLAAHVQVDQFLEEFDATYPEGMEAQPLEMDRFLTFGTYFVLNNGLPEYLISLLRFGYHLCKVAVAPIVEPANKVIAPREAGLRPYYEVRLCEPYRVQDFAYDAYAIASSSPERNWHPQRTRLLFVKNQNSFKRTAIWRITDLPQFVAELIGRPQMLSDLLESYGRDGYWAVAEQLLQFADASTVEFMSPAHFNPSS